MSNNSSNNNNIENESLESPKNDTVTSVEVLKDDKSGEDDKSDKYGATIANIYQWASKLKDEFKSDKEDKSDSDQEEKSDKEDKYSATVTNIYQWASKLKDDFTSEASNITHEVAEKAVTMMLNRLVDGVDNELEAFDKKIEDSKELVANAEEERNKIVDKKDKYQGMIDQLES